MENFPEYGQLSGRKLEDNRAGERVAVDSRKRNPADFALWKASFMRNNVICVMHFIYTIIRSRKYVLSHNVPDSV